MLTVENIHICKHMNTKQGSISWLIRSEVALTGRSVFVTAWVACVCARAR